MAKKQAALPDTEADGAKQQQARSGRAARPVKIAAPTTKKPAAKARRRGKGAATVGWRRMARLADEALQALADDNTKRAREYLEAIRAVALVNSRSDGQ